MSSFFEKITEVFLIQSYLILCFISFSISLIIIFSAQFIFKRRIEKDVMATQSAHQGFVPRVGGVAIYFTILGFSFLLHASLIAPTFLPNLDTGEIYWLVLSAMPIFLIGLCDAVTSIPASAPKLATAK